MRLTRTGAGVMAVAMGLMMSLGGCRNLTDVLSVGPSDPPADTDATPTTDAESPAPPPAPDAAAADGEPNGEPDDEPNEEPQAVVASEFYQQGIDRASSAYTFSQNARSPDEWRLVASRWQQAIDLMGAVPEGDPNRADAQEKIVEYRRNLQAAQQRAEQIVTSSQAPATPIAVAAQPSRNVTAPQTQTPNAAESSSPDAETVYRVPILRRLAGTPVIPVNFNGQRYDMILDTGASATLITAQMASRLNIIPIGRTQVATASASSVSFQVGIVDVIQVGGIVEQNVPVTIAGPELDVGLLGHDIFGNFDITIRQNTVEFRPR